LNGSRVSDPDILLRAAAIDNAWPHDRGRDAELPADSEFRAALAGYLERGTRIAMHNSQPGA
jgi:hypothetical protein